MKRIPFTGYTRERLTTTIEGRTISLRVRYSSESESWFLDLAETQPGTEETPLLSGRRITLGNDLLGSLDLRLGALYAIDTTGAGVDPGAGDLGSRVLIYHLTEAELAAGVIAA
jgi:hypothetical protein